MDSEDEIRERAQRDGNNETPDLADDHEDDDDLGEDGLPVPSLSRTQLAVIGVIVAVVIILILYQREQDEGSLQDAVDHDFSSDVEIEADDEDGDGDLELEIEVPVNSQDPLAGDEAVAEAFRKSGRLSDED